jgi:predicted acetyltransferase
MRFVNAEQALELFPPLYEGVRDIRPGMFSRSPAWWETRRLADDASRRRPGHGQLHLALLDVEGKPAGYAMYRMAPGIVNGITTAKVIVLEVIAPTPEAERELWRFMLDIDWVATIECDYLPLDSALVLLLAEPRRMKQAVSDAVWVRLVDIGEALSRRTLLDAPPVVLEIDDAFCAWNAGRWHVQSGKVERTRAEPDLRLDVSALGSVYLGGFTFGDLVRALRAEELSPGAAARADVLFGSGPAPWCPEIF